MLPLRSPGCSELVLSWLVEEAQKPFNLRDEPLIRIVLAKAFGLAWDVSISPVLFTCRLSCVCVRK